MSRVFSAMGCDVSTVMVFMNKLMPCGFWQLQSAFGHLASCPNGVRVIVRVLYQYPSDHHHYMCVTIECVETSKDDFQFIQWLMSF